MYTSYTTPDGENPIPLTHEESALLFQQIQVSEVAVVDVSGFVQVNYQAAADAAFGILITNLEGEKIGSSPRSSVSPPGPGTYSVPVFLSALLQAPYLNQLVKISIIGNVGPGGNASVSDMAMMVSIK